MGLEMIQCLLTSAKFTSIRHHGVNRDNINCLRSQAQGMSNEFMGKEHSDQQKLPPSSLLYHVVW
jgi:hypothetical protein